MMKYKYLKILLIAIQVFSFSSLFSQIFTDNVNPDQKVIVTMNNGEEFIGTIIQKNDEVLVLNSANGELNLRVLQIAKIEEYTYEGEFLFPSSHETRYFFGPSAIPLKKETGYYHNVYVLGNFINYGLSDNFSIGGGLEFISLMLGHPIYFLTPKVGFKVDEKVHVGGGLIVAGVAGEDHVFLAYGVSTFGTSESNVSIGLGYGKAGDVPGQAIMFSGTQRVSNSMALLTENYIFNDSGAKYYHGVHGVRILSKDNSFDFGLLVSSEFSGDVLPALPYVAYSRAF